MDALVKPAPSQIRKARDDNPKMRERDLAAQLGIAEAEFVAAWVGEGATRDRAQGQRCAHRPRSGGRSHSAHPK